MKKFKIGPAELLGAASLVVGIIKTVIDNKKEANDQKTMKEEITNDAVKKVMEKLSQEKES